MTQNIHPFKLIRGKSLFTSISSTAKQYASIKVRMHNDACSALIMAAEHGNCDALNQMFGYLPKMYQNALRDWCGDQSGFVAETSEGEEKTFTWLGFKTDTGFHVKKGSKFAEPRAEWAGQWEGLKAGNLPQFFAGKDEDKPPQPVDIFKLLNGVLNKAEKHSDEPVDGDIIPDAVVSGIRELIKMNPANTLAA